MPFYVMRGTEVVYGPFDTHDDADATREDADPEQLIVEQRYLPHSGGDPAPAATVGTTRMRRHLDIAGLGTALIALDNHPRLRELTYLERAAFLLDMTYGAVT